MGLFKGMKDMANLTKQAKQLQEQQQQDAGYKPGVGGQMQQMGDMLSSATEQMGELMDQSGDQKRIMAEGIPGEATVVGMGTPARGAQKYNLDLDLEVRVKGKSPYRVANEYIVPAAVPLGPGVVLPIRVDPNDEGKIAIDWQNAATGPARGEVRPASGASTVGQVGASGAGGSDDGDSIAELERLVKLRDSGALTDAEFEQQKAKILGS